MVPGAVRVELMVKTNPRALPRYPQKADPSSPPFPLSFCDPRSFLFCVCHRPCALEFSAEEGGVHGVTCGG